MNLEPILSAEIASIERLRELEIKYRRSQQKIWVLVAIPLLWLIGASVARMINELWAWQALVGWCLLCAFLGGVFILYQIPSKDDVIHDYSQAVLPGLFKHFGADKVLVARRHDLHMKTILEAGLYYDKYNTISREDCVQGHINGIDFGMYEVALQIGGSVISPQAGTTATTRTNYFYGWFVMMNTSRVHGFHFITLRNRIASGEADDWSEKTIAHWEKDITLQKVATEDGAFNELFLLNSDHPEVLLQLLTPSMRESLIQFAETASNSFAISIQRGHVFLLIGHDNADLRKAPSSGNFTEGVDPELQRDVAWYANMVKKLSQIGLR